MKDQEEYSISLNRIHALSQQIYALNAYGSEWLAQQIMNEVEKLKQHHVLTEDAAVILDCAERHLPED